MTRFPTSTLPQLGYVVTDDHKLGDVLVCPMCLRMSPDRQTYIRSGRVSLVEGHDNYEAWEGRGDALAIAMNGECGHSWALCLGFHKGQTFLFNSLALTHE